MKLLYLMLIILFGCSQEQRPVATPVRAISLLKEVSSLQLKFDGGGVSSIISDGKGGLFIGGDFDSVTDAKGKVEARAVVHVLENGYVSRRFKIRFKDQQAKVSTLHWTGKHLIVGGTFNKIGKRIYPNLARVHFNGVLNKAWHPLVPGPVSALAIQAGNIFVSGADKDQPFVMKIPHAKNPKAEAFLDFTTAGVINDILIKDNYLLLAGNFEYESHGKKASHLMGVDLEKRTLLWNPEIKYTGGKIEVKDLFYEPLMKRLFIAGKFNYVGTELRVNAAAFRFERDLTFEPQFAPVGFNNSINSIGVSRDMNYLLLGGNFSIANKELVKGLSVYDYKTLQVLPLEKFKVMVDYNMGEPNVSVIYPWGNLALIGGNISSVNKFSGPFFNFYDLNSCVHCSY